MAIFRWRLRLRPKKSSRNSTDPVADGRALAYGHSYTGNALGCAAARAGLAIFREENVLAILQPKIRQLDSQLQLLRELPGVTEVRQCGFVAGIEMDDAETAKRGLSSSARLRIVNEKYTGNNRVAAAALHHG